MSSANPWKTLSSRLIYTNPWISLREDQVIRPDGQPGIYSVVDTRIATGVVALDSEQHVYLIGQFRYPINAYSWEIVEGGTESDEDAFETAKRELREEAGLVAASWKPLGPDVHLSNCFSSEVAKLYLARELSRVPMEPDGTEVLQVRRLPLACALEMVESGEITDAMSVIGLSRAAALIQRESGI